MNIEYNYKFGDFPSKVIIQDKIPSWSQIEAFFEPPSTSSPAKRPALIVCDTNTESRARKISGDEEIPVLVLQSGEEYKTWESVEAILRAAKEAGLGRDGIFAGFGGGVICDLCAFAASVYMRGSGLCLVSTTLLGMVDASVGGKTGFDLFGLKNIAGTFYPAAGIIMPVEALDTLPEKEWKSGMAELIKTSFLCAGNFTDSVKELIRLRENKNRNKDEYRSCLKKCIASAVDLKGAVVESDPKETGGKRAVLNFGHTFGHALEAALGLGAVTHGEAVAWGMARACELGTALGVTSARRAAEIVETLQKSGYETRAPHPLLKSPDSLIKAMKSDKKQEGKKLKFIVPDETGVMVLSAADCEALEGKSGENLILKITGGENL